jgi:hypothetical protein
MTRSLALNYAAVTTVLTAYFVWLGSAVSTAPEGRVDPRELLPALFALVALTALVWLLMLLARNIAVAIGKVAVGYYRSYRDDVPPEWIERPARTFMNLLEVPVLFYVACLLMLVTRECDGAQVLLAGAFVATRAVHALIYIGINHVPARFGAYVAGCVTLGVIWVRLAGAVL